MAYKVPDLLFDWLNSREMNPGEMTGDQLYSAALELQADMLTDYDYSPHETTPGQRAAVTRYVNRMAKTCKRLPLESWY